MAGMSVVAGGSAADGHDEKLVGTQAIRRACAVLALFRDARSELGIAQIAAALALRHSTVHRIVRALVAEGYLAQNAETERYYLSRGAVLLGMAAQRDLGLSAVMPILERIGLQTSESVNLGIPDGTHALVVLRVQSPLPLRFDQPPGTRVPLHASAMGKSVFAFGGADFGAYAQEVGGKLTRYTPATITSLRALRKELAETRARGYSVDREESIAGVRCVGAPILGPEGTARAAMAVQAPAVRMPESRIADLAEQVVTAAKEAAEVLPVGHPLGGATMRAEKSRKRDEP